MGGTPIFRRAVSNTTNSALKSKIALLELNDSKHGSIYEMASMGLFIIRRDNSISLPRLNLVPPQTDVPTAINQ